MQSTKALLVLTILSILLLFYVVNAELNKNYYFVDEENSRSSLTIPGRMNAATFVRNNVAYTWGGEGDSSTTTFRDIVPYFNSISVNNENRTVSYTFVESSTNYQNFATGASAVLHPNDTNTVYFFGGYRQTALAIPEDGPLYVEQYNFGTTEWTSVQYQTQQSDGTPASPPVNRAYFTAVAIDGFISISGGIGTGANETTDGVPIWLFDPNRNVFTPVIQQVDPGFAKSDNAVAISDGRIVYIPAVCELVYIFSLNTRNITTQPVHGYNQVLGGNLLSSVSSETDITARSGGYAFIDPKDQWIVYFTGWSYSTKDDDQLITEFNERLGTSESKLDLPISFEFTDDMNTESYDRFGYQDSLKLDTNTWTWKSIEYFDPSTLSNYGMLRNASFAVFDSKSILVMFGNDQNNDQPDNFYVIHQPSFGSNISEKLVLTIAWFASDASYYDFLTKFDTGRNQTKAILMIIGLSLLLVSLFVLCWMFSWYRNVTKARKLLQRCKPFLSTAYYYFLWNPRAGEPKWAETSRLASKVVLSFIFCVYLVYNINLVITSPLSTLTSKETVDSVFAPDVRLCFKGVTSVNVTYGNRRFPHVVPGSETSVGTTDLLIFDRSKRYPNSTYHPLHFNTHCMVYRAGTMSNDMENSIDFFYTYEPDDAMDVRSVQVEFYPRGLNPNVPIYLYDYSNNDTDSESLHNLYFAPDVFRSYYDRYFTSDEMPPTPLHEGYVRGWAENDLLNNPAPNRYDVDLNNTEYPIFSYKLQTHRYLTDSKWNRIGFAPIYNDTPEITTTFLTSVRDNNAMGTGNESIISMQPAEVATIILEDRYMYTIASILGPIGGLLSLLIALDSCVFGARPKSPWGLIHWIPSTRIKTSLHQNLYENYGFLGRPVPFVNPVDDQLFNIKRDKQMLSDHRLQSITVTPDVPHLSDSSGDRKQLTITNNLTDDGTLTSTVSLLQEQLFETRTQLSKLATRTQLQELLLKSYYIDDELIQALYDAHDDDNIVKDPDDGTVIDMEDSRPDTSVRERLKSALTWRLCGRHKRNDKANSDAQESAEYIDVTERPVNGSISSETTQFIKSE